MAPVRKKQKVSDDSTAVTAEHGTSIATSAEVKPAQQRRSLFVRSLPASTTTEILTDLFSESYPVRHATAIIDPATKQCRGYGFVTFADAEDAERAKEEFNGHTLEGRKLRVEVAEPRHRDPEHGAAKETEGFKPTKGQKDLPQPSRLIVRNLPWTIKTSEQLSKLFLSYGKIKQAYIPKKGPGLMAGFGFVVLRGRKNAEKALAGINGKEVDGRTLAVDWAVSKDAYADLMKTDGDQETVDGEETEMEAEEVEMEGSDDEADEAGMADKDDELEKTDDEDEEYRDGEKANDDEDVDLEDEDAHGSPADQLEDRSATLFVRNLPFTCTDEDLEDHFSAFGSTRYARVVMDFGTDRSKGTGFVAFYDKADAESCLRGAPARIVPSATGDSKDSNAIQNKNSILQNEATDPSGQYTMDGRVLQISRAVEKSEASRLTQEGTAHRHKRDTDKRRLYLLSEGTISSKSKLWDSLSPSERTMREASSKQRKMLIESNPSLHLSLTRLSIRNIPRSIDSKQLKALAREAVVGFATDVKAGTRQKLSKEELMRGGEDMQAAELARKKAGKGVVKQAKVVFEGAGGSKVDEDSGAGRSRGYGFIEYYTHRNALMGLRWLNGHAVGYQVKEGKKSKVSREEVQDRKKRLIVEFAIENAQVVLRRKDKENKARDRSLAVKDGLADNGGEGDAAQKAVTTASSKKRKRGTERTPKVLSNGTGKSKSLSNKTAKSRSTGSERPAKRSKEAVDEKTARRNQIIGRKRAMRKTRKGAK